MERCVNCWEQKEYDAFWTKWCENVFSYHKPKEGQPEKYEIIRDKAKEFGTIIAMQCPDSDEKGQALKALREAVMWANASIACNEDA